MVLTELFTMLLMEMVSELPSSQTNLELKDKTHPESLWKLHSLKPKKLHELSDQSLNLDQMPHDNTSELQSQPYHQSIHSNEPQL